MMLGVMLRKSTNDSLNKANLTTVLRFAQENEQPELLWHSYDVLGDIYASEQAHIQACIAYQKPSISAIRVNIYMSGLFLT